MPNSKTPLVDRYNPMASDFTLKNADGPKFIPKMFRFLNAFSLILNLFFKIKCNQNPLKPFEGRSQAEYFKQQAARYFDWKWATEGERAFTAHNKGKVTEEMMKWMDDLPAVE